MITAGNKPKKKSKGYERQGNERVEPALVYKPKNSPLGNETRITLNHSGHFERKKKKMFDILIRPKARIKNLRQDETEKYFLKKCLKASNRYECDFHPV